MCPPRILLLLYASIALPGTFGWVQWGYERDGPGPRSEHSLVMFNDTVYTFGGRGNPEFVTHDPRTFSTERVNGTVQFASYSQKHVVPCLDPSGNPLNIKGLTPEQYEECYTTQVGTSRNDVWYYNLNCTRQGDRPCSGQGWQVLVAGAVQGGCRNYNDQLMCTHPQERYGHAAAILYEGTPRDLPGERAQSAHLLVYGGHAQLCENYCSDMWALNLTQCTLNTSAGAGCRWREVGVMGDSGPGKRWRAASAHDNTRWVVFGGHRVWQGLAPENDAGNDWGNFSSLPYGGFLDDLWVYTWADVGVGEYVYGGSFNNGTGYAAQYGAVPVPDPATPNTRELSLGAPVRVVKCSLGSNCLGKGAWTQVLPREECFKDPGGDFPSRNDITCRVKWPPPRSMGALALSGDSLYLYGGYRVGAYPYPHTNAAGSGKGVLAVKSDGTIPYPLQPQFLGDLWVFNWASGLWREMTPTRLKGTPPPAPRRGHNLVFAGAALLLQGGNSYGNLLNDLWIYNISLNHWLQVTVYPYPQFSPNCTSDVDANDSPYYFTDAITGDLVFKKSVTLAPNRELGVAADGLFGRPSSPILVTASRRRSFGWDGCRDRADGNKDLPPGLTYDQPSQRQDSRAIWSMRSSLLFMYGGDAQDMPTLPTINTTYPSTSKGDFWAWSSAWCPANCTGHGSCVWGHCYCRDGYYGTDCSNVTCGGDYCAYDTANHLQTCSHCCASGWAHSDGEDYMPGVRKIPCDATHPGEVNGICDGFGQCVCAPPFLGADCSTKDCRDNCTSIERGYCSAEYPVSRCVCAPPYAGFNCSLTTCLNNCSFPNGLCDTSSGLCTCKKLANPFDNKVPWSAYGGDDCSWVPAFCGAQGGAPSLVALCATGLLGVALALGGWEGDP